MTHMPFGDLSTETFLAEYWQKKPLLIRQAFPDFVSPLEPDEVAGLACQPDTISRLILEHGGDYPWQVRQGPFREADFEGLGDCHWTVLVQEVDHHVPAIADLFDRFTFVPHWRKDDVMVSFAAKDAGVGPHTDSYDVFLLQATGRRRWEIAPAGDHWIDRQGLDLKMIDNFEPTEIYELEPGDMLYLPPGVPHNGIAIEPCLTFSFGFLAPSRAEVISDFANWYESKYGVIRYSDPDLVGGHAPGLIAPSDLNRLLRLIREAPIETEHLAEWFGSFITRPPRGLGQTLAIEGSLEDFCADFQNSNRWRRYEGIRIAGWAGAKPHLFVNGEVWASPLTKKAIELLSNHRELTFFDVKGDTGLLETLYQLTMRGWGYFPGTEDFDDDPEPGDD